MAIKGAIKVNGIPEAACFTTFTNLLQSLEQYLTVEIPDQNFSNVIVSVSQPGAADTSKLWVQLGASGTFLAFKMFDPATQTWVAIFPVPGQITWIGPTAEYPNSATPPPGYSFTLISTIFTGADLTALMSNAILDGAGPDYVYFPAVWVGL